MESVDKMSLGVVYFLKVASVLLLQPSIKYLRTNYLVSWVLMLSNIAGVRRMKKGICLGSCSFVLKVSMHLTIV